MTKIKVLTVVGTRPEIIRLSRVIPCLDTYCDHILVHTGQNYDHELNEIFFDDLNLRNPDYILQVAGKNGAETIGNVIIATDKLFDSEKPDALLVLGDTNSCMAAIAAKRRKIPIFHMEAGNRCFDLRVPEEINRKIIDHIADINLPYSSIARSYLMQEGLTPDRIIKIGSPMFEVLTHYHEKINQSTILHELDLKQFQYFLVSVHREENIEPDDQFKKFIDLLNGLAIAKKIPIIVSTHPRTSKRIKSSNMEINPLVNLIKPLSFTQYNNLQINASATLSDSGTISEESSIMNFPALNLRQTHERPEAMEEGAVMMVGFNLERTLQALKILNTQHRGKERNLMEVKDYCTPNVSDKVLRIIISYIDYINRFTWRK